MNTETKRHIDAARQVLVGVVPNPTAQIDQITYALIYKFMDDMDQAAIKNGDEPSFFVEDLEQYSWARLMDSKIGNQDRMNIYVMAFQKFAEAKQLPELFRNILKSAFLPYRSPETLGLFLKEINYFDYSHPEELGNAYEYLLSIMGSQGDAGQFRTPRHIIDFIVSVVNPTKDDKILDPACGTGGFLVSSYKHILEQHDRKDDPNKKEKPLTPDQRKSLMENFEGYDIDTTMVRIAQVNMYLHQFKNPKIFQYDTLSSDERWNSKYDIVMANPPFMSPKGGIRPHNKFSIQSSRSEVLFVDYIMNHLRPKGRAGVIVPEGVIFQSGNAYKQLRKSLVGDGLYAVVSLPSGVFQPYSGVKTSILFFNNELAKSSKEILFIKIENDGFDLGATKKPINKNDLPQAFQELRAYKEYLESGKVITPFIERVKKEKNNKLEAIHHDRCILVKKTFIAEGGDYNLSGDRYKPSNLPKINSKWPMVSLDKICTVLNGYAFKSNLFNDLKKGVPIIRIRDVNSGYTETYYSGGYDKKYIVCDGDLLIGMDGDFKATIWKYGRALLNQRVCRLENFTGVDKKYVYYLIQKKLGAIQEKTYAVTVKHLSSSQIEKIEIPLPPIEIQEEIVAELDGYAGVIAGAKQIAQNWKSKIDINPEWKKVKLRDIANLIRGVVYSKTDEIDSDGYKILRAMNIALDGNLLLDDIKQISSRLILKDQQKLKEGDIFICLASGSKNHIGKVAYIEKNMDFYYGGFMGSIRVNKKYAIPRFVYFSLKDSKFNDYLRLAISGANINNLNSKILGKFEISLPPLEIQKQIIEKTETERKLVEASKKLIKIYEGKIEFVIEKQYGHND
jgi:type I restriction enzyme M protein